MNRLGWEERITQAFDPWEETIPAVAQGILGVEYRESDERVLALIEPLCIKDVEIAREAERAVLTALAGGCQLPLGAYCRITEDACEIKGVVLSVDGREAIYAHMPVDFDQPAESGRALAALLLDQGAREILQAMRKHTPVSAP